MTKTVRLWSYLISNDDWRQFNDAARHAVSFGLRPELVVTQSAMRDGCWFGRMDIRFDEDDQTDSRRVASIGEEVLAIAADIAERLKVDIDKIFDMDLLSW